MIVCSGEIELSLPGSRSLKNRRQILNSIKERVRHRFNVAVAEVGEGTGWQRASLGVVTVSTTVVHARQVLQKLEGFLENDDRIQVLGCTVEER